MGDVPNYQQVVTQDGGREGSHGAGAASRGAAATRPPWWRFWPGSEKPHQSPDGPAAANNGMTKPKLKTSEQTQKRDRRCEGSVEDRVPGPIEGVQQPSQHNFVSRRHII